MMIHGVVSRVACLFCVAVGPQSACPAMGLRIRYSRDAVLPTPRLGRSRICLPLGFAQDRVVSIPHSLQRYVTSSTRASGPLDRTPWTTISRLQPGHTTIGNRRFLAPPSRRSRISALLGSA